MKNLPIDVIYKILEYTGKFKIKDGVAVSIIAKDDKRYKLLEDISKIKRESEIYSYVLFKKKVVSENIYILYNLCSYNYNKRVNIYFSKHKYKNDKYEEYIVYS